MSKLVTIFGGSGFVGRYIARRMAQQGWRVRVAVRRPNEALFVKPYGAVGQVEPVFCNIRADASVAAVLEGADAAVNCVGIMSPHGKNTFESVHSEAAGRIARIAAEKGISNLVHLSAIGADSESASQYARSKGEGEVAVLAEFPGAVILRPSIIFGPEDDFFNRFAGMSRFGPVLPIAGASTQFQPVYVDDVAKAAELGVSGAAEAGVYELGGPDVARFDELVAKMLDVIHRRRIVLGLPNVAARVLGLVGDIVNFTSFQLVPAPITRDQVRLLQSNNVVSEGAKGLADMGIDPASLDAVLPEYLWRFRPSGQYDDIRDSARDMRA